MRSATAFAKVPTDAALPSGAPIPKAAAAPRENEDSATQLLRRLAEPGTCAERHDGAVRLIAADGAVIGTSPSAALSALVESGAVICRREGGRARFFIGEEGHKALFRRQAGDNPFGDQHRTIRDEHRRSALGETEHLRVNLREDPLAMLARQKDGFARDFIGASGFEAGARLQREMELARFEPRMNIDLTRVAVDGRPQGGMLALPERAMAARNRVADALRAVGPDHAGVLTDLCGFSKGIEQIERERGLPQRSAKLWVSLALRALALHYGLSDEARGPKQGKVQAARSI